MRIYFGRLPQSDEVEFLDYMLLSCLVVEDYNMDKAVDTLVADLMTNWDEDDFKDVVCHTVNPLIVSYFTDDFIKEYLYFIDADGTHIKVGDDESMMKTLEWSGPGAMLWDDERVMVWNV